jgi:hypothetical protein
MARDRLDLQTILESITDNVYFQPPSNVQMKYPCIVYNRDAEDAKFADNVLYGHKQRYQVTVISQDPDSAIPGQIRQLPLCSFDRFFTADNLNHDVFTIFF